MNNNRKRPAVSDSTLTRRYSRRIVANNNVDACLDDCVDDIILSIASYLTSYELLKLALTCKRFGARSTEKVRDKQDDAGETKDNAILSNGLRVFVRPSTTGTTVTYSNNYQNRECTFMEGVITEHSHITESYRVEFKSQKLKLNGNNIQWVNQDELVSVEDMTKRVEQSLRFCVKREEDSLSTNHYIMLDLGRWGIESKFVESIATSMMEQMNVSLQNKDWSLMEEAALLKAISLSSEEGYLMWREGESWMGVCQQLEQEMKLLEEEYNVLYLKSDNVRLYDDADVSNFVSAICIFIAMMCLLLYSPSSPHQDRFLDGAFEFSEYIENDMTQIQSRIELAPHLFQRNINRLQRSSDAPLGDKYTKDVHLLVGLYENGVSGMLIDRGDR